MHSEETVDSQQQDTEFGWPVGPNEATRLIGGRLRGRVVVLRDAMC